MPVTPQGAGLCTTLFILFASFYVFLFLLLPRSNGFLDSFEQHPVQL